MATDLRLFFVRRKWMVGLSMVFPASRAAGTSYPMHRGPAPDPSTDVSPEDPLYSGTHLPPTEERGDASVDRGCAARWCALLKVVDLEHPRGNNSLRQVETRTRTSPRAHAQARGISHGGAGGARKLPTDIRVPGRKFASLGTQGHGKVVAYRFATFGHDGLDVGTLPRTDRYRISHLFHRL